MPLKMASAIIEKSKLVTTDTPVNLLGNGYLSNFIDYKLSTKGVDVYDWVLREDFYEWVCFLDFVKKAEINA